MKAKFSNDRFGLKTNRYEKESEQRFPVCAGLCLAAVFGLSACKDDDEGGGDGGAGAVAQQMPLVANAGIQFPVTQYLNEDYSEMETYTYADGRMTGAATSWEGYSYLITSNPLVLVEQSYYSDTEYGSSTMRNIRVNENGFMTYAEFSFEESDSYDGNSYDRGYNTWEYDAEGHLVGESGNITETSDEDGPYSWTCTYTWENGYLMNAEYRDEEGGRVNRTVCTFAYGDGQWNNPGVYPARMIEVSFMGMPVLFYSGLLGRSTKNIPTSVTVRYFEGDVEYPNTYNTVAVNYNQDQSVKSIEVQNVYSSYTRAYRYGYAGYPIEEETYSAAPTVKKGGQTAKGLKRAWRMMRR